MNFTHLAGIERAEVNATIETLQRVEDSVGVSLADLFAERDRLLKQGFGKKPQPRRRRRR